MRETTIIDADKVNILIVDDMPEQILVLETILADLGENVVAVRSGQEALRQVLEREFSVILLDVNMPDMDGYETAGLIRRRKKSAHTPIIFVTAYADEVHTAKGYALGAVDYILSPVVPEVLRTKVKVFVDLLRMTQQVKRQADERVALAHEQAARSAAEDTIRRLNFLGEATKVLASSLEYELVLRDLVRLMVPQQADLSVIALVDDHGRRFHTEAARVDEAGTIHERVPNSALQLADSFEQAISNAVVTKKSAYLSELSTETVGSSPFSKNGQAIQHDSIATPLTALVLPLVAGGRMLGALLLSMTHSGRRFGPAEVALAEGVARRAAIAMDNVRLYRDIQEADRRKNEFLSMLAHELRNPLVPILNGIHIMRMRGPSAADRDQVQTMIERQVQHLVRMVDDLLDISRITRGKIQLRTESVDLAIVAYRALEASRPLLDSRGHELTIDLPPTPVSVQADAVRLAQVLTNLLNNAAKYTEERGHVWLTVTREKDEAVIRVRDNGMGIPPEMLSSVFDLFTQAERTLDRSQGGLGVGLTLVRRLVEMHGGTVQALSAGPNQGSEFVVRLPLLPEPAPDDREPVTAKPSETARVLRVLIVDDNVDAAESLAMLLQEGGNDVKVAYDGPAALQAAAMLRPDVVLLDIGLPGMDGYEVARRLRRQEGSTSSLLIALTGYGQERDIQCSQQAGFDRHLVKPVDPALLLAQIAGAPRCGTAPAPRRSFPRLALAGVSAS